MIANYLYISLICLILGIGFFFFPNKNKPDFKYYLIGLIIICLFWGPSIIIALVYSTYNYFIKDPYRKALKTTNKALKFMVDSEFYKDIDYTEGFQGVQIQIYKKLNELIPELVNVGYIFSICQYHIEDGKVNCNKCIMSKNNRNCDNPVSYFQKYYHASNTEDKLIYAKSMRAVFNAK